MGIVLRVSCAADCDRYGDGHHVGGEYAVSVDRRCGTFSRFKVRVNLFFLPFFQTGVKHWAES